MFLFVHCLDVSTISLVEEWLVGIFDSSYLTDVMCFTRIMNMLSSTEEAIFEIVLLWLQHSLQWEDSVWILAMFWLKSVELFDLDNKLYRIHLKGKGKSDLHQVKVNCSWYFLKNPFPIILAYDRITELFGRKGRSMPYSIYCHRWASNWGLNLKRVLIEKKRCLTNA